MCHPVDEAEHIPVGGVEVALSSGGGELGCELWSEAGGVRRHLVQADRLTCIEILRLRLVKELQGDSSG